MEKINLNHQVPLNQLYAQLFHLFKAGFQFWFDESEIALLNEKNAQFRYISVEEEALVAHFEPCHAGDETSFLQTTQIQQALVQKTGFKSLSIQVLGRVLRDMKFERVKRNGVYGYLVKEKKHRI